MTRADLPPAVQAVQAAHAALAFAVRHPDTITSWDHRNGSLLLLAASSELELHRLLAVTGSLPAAAFREPDLDGQVTAIAIHDAARLCSKLPLAFSEQYPRMSPPARPEGQPLHETS